MVQGRGAKNGVDKCTEWDDVGAIPEYIKGIGSAVALGGRG